MKGEINEKEDQGEGRSYSYLLLVLTNKFVDCFHHCSLFMAVSRRARIQ
jgi:hypothetical protein